MSEMKRCSACGKENLVSEMKACMHHQMHRYVCDSKCMTDFYNLPKKPTAAELEAKVATLEAENAKLRAELERRAVPDGWRELLQEVAEYAPPYGTIVAMTSQMALGSKARRMLAAAPSAPKADDPVKVQLLEALTDSLELMETLCAFEGDTIRKARAAIAAAQEGGKV